MLEVLNRNNDSQIELNDPGGPTFSTAFIIIAIDADEARSVDSDLGLSLPFPCGEWKGSTFVAIKLHGTTDSIRFPISDFRHF